jgi:hypothetical protein
LKLNINLSEHWQCVTLTQKWVISEEFSSTLAEPDGARRYYGLATERRKAIFQAVLHFDENKADVVVYDPAKCADLRWSVALLDSTLQIILFCVRLQNLSIKSNCFRKACPIVSYLFIFAF